MTNSKLTLLNAIVNQPDILRMVAPGYEYVDMAPFFTNPNNVLLGNENGVVIFVCLGEGIYSCHFLLTDRLRGRDALTAIKLSFTALFTMKDCVAITGLIPRENRASRAIARALGCRPIGSVKDIHGRSCISYIMERESWVTLSGESLEVSGHC